LHIHETVFQPDCITRALEHWDDDGGALGREPVRDEFDRRIEADGSWTLYRVSTGAPARIGGHLMEGMNAVDSLNRLAKVNARNRKLLTNATGCGARSVRRWYEMHIW
jgi:hypothetical protein